MHINYERIYYQSIIFPQGLNGEVYDDDLPYTTLSYSDGPEFERWYQVNETDSTTAARKDLTQDTATLKTFDSAR